MYVDNMLTGTNSKTEAKEICKQITDILKTAGINIRQWASNDIDILDQIDRKDFDINFNISDDSSLK